MELLVAGIRKSWLAGWLAGTSVVATKYSFVLQNVSELFWGYPFPSDGTVLEDPCG
jgi:hypothetical protein